MSSSGYSLGLRQEDTLGRKVTRDGRKSSCSSLVGVWFHANVTVGGMRYLHRGFEFEVDIHHRWIPPRNDTETQGNPTEDIALCGGFAGSDVLCDYVHLYKFKTGTMRRSVSIGVLQKLERTKVAQLKVEIIQKPCHDLHIEELNAFGFAKSVLSLSQYHMPNGFSQLSVQWYSFRKRLLSDSRIKTK